MESPKPGKPVKTENHKTTTIQHIRGKPPADRFTYLALELSRRADGTIDIEAFKANLEIAYDALKWIQDKINAEPNWQSISE